MKEHLPPPLTPPDCDLRCLDWFPFYHKRLLQSAFWSRASDQACRISVDFWSVAYEQVPAASLPDDDFLLAEWSGFGRRGTDEWAEIKLEVMSAWTLCFDGRWYHPTLSEVACEAWSRRRIHLWQRECDRIRKDNKRRAEKKLDPLELPSRPPDDPFFDADGVHVFSGNEAFSAGNDDHSGGQSGNDPFSDGKVELSGGHPAENDQQSPESALTGTGTGTNPSGKGPSRVVDPRGVVPLPRTCAREAASGKRPAERRRKAVAR